MNRTILFIPGAGVQHAGTDDPLQRGLREALPDYDVRSPGMPSPENPRYPEWKDAVAGALEAAGHEPFLVGHSLGGSVVVKYLSEEGASLPVGGLFLLAAPYWGSAGWAAAEYTLRADYMDRLRSEMPVFIYHSRDDDVVPISHAARYAREIRGARARLLDGRGHEFRPGLPELVGDVRALESSARGPA